MRVTLTTMLLKKLNFYTFWLLVGASSIVHADEFEISSNLFFFNYEEYSVTGTLLDKEKGVLPGFKVHYSKSFEYLRFDTFAAFNGGEIDYIGSTQSGSPHNTKTNEKLLTYGVELSIEPALNSQFEYVLGLRKSNWDRDIQTINNVIGLHEIYDWYEVNAGLRYKSIPLNKESYFAQASLLKISNPTIKIFLENSSETLNIGEEPGIRLIVGKIWYRNNNQIKLSLISEYWKFGRSNSVFTNDFFGSSVVITEPESNSFHNTLQLTYKAKF